eukprot:TRINITY_DN10118_c0_g1_i1.p2 TRINITY_DN10118_c0_g1~~TRINITY_DN10118_c0_g1_i1.p2  ORF type:complete len:138 (+),score=26.45 TRINITY_DN10118_c0_g1_i1:480-893(+)
MSIKSFDELRKIRKEAMEKVDLRSKGEQEGDVIEVMVGMATCGIAAGAREAMAAIMEEIKEKDVKNVKVIQVGCLGFCHSEPTVQVNMPGSEPFLYGNVDTKTAKAIVDKHIINGEILEDHILIKSFKRANVIGEEE